jgi:hypothetical protein
MGPLSAIYPVIANFPRLVVSPKWVRPPGRPGPTGLIVWGPGQHLIRPAT